VVVLRSPREHSQIILSLKLKFFFLQIKPQPNHREYLRALRKMTGEQRLAKAFELSAIAKELFLAGLRKRFPDKSEQEIKTLYLERIKLCYNRNY